MLFTHSAGPSAAGIDCLLRALCRARHLPPYSCGVLILWSRTRSLWECGGKAGVGISVWQVEENQCWLPKGRTRGAKARQPQTDVLDPCLGPGNAEEARRSADNRRRFLSFSGRTREMKSEVQATSWTPRPARSAAPCIFAWCEGLKPASLPSRRRICALISS